MITRIVSILLISLAFSNANGQLGSQEKQCETDHVITLQKEALLDFDFRNKQQELMIENHLKNRYHNQSNYKSVGTDEYVIPVVVHVIYNDNEPTANIPYDQVLSQIDALNEAFQATTSGELTHIRFCLSKTPSGTAAWTDPLEPGVMRYEDATPGHIYGDHEITDASANTLLSLTHPTALDFPFANYLNIWVVNSINAPSLVQGYSPLPILPEIGVSGYPLDGIVIRHDVFGDNSNTNYCQCFNLQTSPVDRTEGKVLVHEAGHYLRLYHLFHNGCSGGQAQGTGGINDCSLYGDFVCDTPPCTQPSNSNSFCSPGTANSCTAPDEFQSSYPSNISMASPNDGYDMVNNYMYYAADPCLSTFSQGQADRMQAFIQTSRANLTSLDNLFDVGVVSPTGCVLPELKATILTATGVECINTNVTLNTPTGPAYSATGWSWSFSPTIGVSFVSGTSASDQLPVVQFANPGSYMIYLTATDGNTTVTDSTQLFVSACSPLSGNQNHWYFGEFAAIDFSSGLPVPHNTALVNMTMDADETALTESDPITGELLFYTNGTAVWDGNHTLVNPGDDLLGEPSTTQSISIPDPGNSNQYYVFFPTLTPFWGSNNVLPKYSVINVSSGVSVVTSDSLPLPTGILRTSEAVTTVPHCNGVDYWIIFHGYGGDPNFYVYRLSDQGLTNGDFSSNLPDVYVSNNQIGQDLGGIVASTDGTRLAQACVPTISTQSLGGLAIYDFDNTTGEISNGVVLSTDGTYMASFAPNNRDILYTTNTFWELIQYDIAGGTSQVLATNAGTGIQLGPDGRIYICLVTDPILKSIDDPDNLLAPAYNVNAVDFGTISPTIKAGNGLIHFMDAEKPTALDLDFSLTYNANCTDINVLLDPCWSTYGIEFDFGDGTVCSGDFYDAASCPNSTGFMNNLNHTYADGTFTVTLTLISGVGTQSVSKLVTIQTAAPQIQGIDSVCQSEITDYSVINDPNYSYDWSISGGLFSNGTTMATGSLVTASWNGIGTGTIALTTTNTLQPQCNASTTKNVVINDCALGFNENELNATNVRLYPNPSNGYLTVSLENGAHPELVLDLTIRDVSGKLVHASKFKHNTTSLDLNGLESGIYFLSLTSDGGSVTQRFVMDK